MKQEILIGQTWKSNYADITYKVLGGVSHTKVEVYDVENIWDCKEVYKKDLRERFTLQAS